MKVRPLACAGRRNKLPLRDGRARLENIIVEFAQGARAPSRAVRRVSRGAPGSRPLIGPEYFPALPRRDRFGGCWDCDPACCV